MKNKFIFLFISSLFCPFIISATGEDNTNCPSKFTPLKLVQSNSESTQSANKINYPTRALSSLMENNFPQFPPKERLQFIKSALRYEAGVDTRVALKQAKSEEEFEDMRLPVGHSGREFVERYDVILGWIIDQLSDQNQSAKLQILRAVYRMIFELDSNVAIIYPKFTVSAIKHHFDSILRFLLQYKQNGSLPDSFHSEHSNQKTEIERAEERIQIITQLW